MERPSRIALAPGMMISLWSGTVAPLVVGLSMGGFAAALGAAFVVACPLLVLSSTRRRERPSVMFPLYFGGLFVFALAAFEFNSPAFVVDTWSALLLGMLTVPKGRPKVPGKHALSFAH